MPDIIAMQEALTAMSARALQVAPSGCAQTYASFQYRVTDGEPSFDYLAPGVVAVDGSWRFGQFDFDQEMLELANTHRQAFGDEPWTTLELTVNGDGTFHADQSYGSVPDDGMAPEIVARMESYPRTWVAEHGPTPPKKRRWFGK